MAQVNNQVNKPKVKDNINTTYLDALYEHLSDDLRDAFIDFVLREEFVVACKARQFMILVSSNIPIPDVNFVDHKLFQKILPKS